MNLCSKIRIELADELLGDLKRSVLGPLYFLLMINDLAFIIEL